MPQINQQTILSDAPHRILTQRTLSHSRAPMRMTDELKILFGSYAKQYGLHDEKRYIRYQPGNAGSDRSKHLYVFSNKEDAEKVRKHLYYGFRILTEIKPLVEPIVNPSANQAEPGNVYFAVVLEQKQHELLQELSNAEIFNEQGSVSIKDLIVQNLQRGFFQKLRSRFKSSRSEPSSQLHAPYNIERGRNEKYEVIIETPNNKSIVKNNKENISQREAKSQVAIALQSVMTPAELSNWEEHAWKFTITCNSTDPKVILYFIAEAKRLGVGIKLPELAMEDSFRLQIMHAQVSANQFHQEVRSQGGMPHPAPPNKWFSFFLPKRRLVRKGGSIGASSEPVAVLLPPMSSVIDGSPLDLSPAAAVGSPRDPVSPPSPRSGVSGRPDVTGLSTVEPSVGPGGPGPVAVEWPPTIHPEPSVVSSAGRSAAAGWLPPTIHPEPSTVASAAAAHATAATAPRAGLSAESGLLDPSIPLPASADHAGVAVDVDDLSTASPTSGRDAFPSLRAVPPAGRLFGSPASDTAPEAFPIPPLDASGSAVDATTPPGATPDTGAIDGVAAAPQGPTMPEGVVPPPPAAPSRSWLSSLNPFTWWGGNTAPAEEQEQKPDGPSAPTPRPRS